MIPPNVFVKFDGAIVPLAQEFGRGTSHLRRDGSQSLAINVSQQAFVAVGRILNGRNGNQPQFQDGREGHIGNDVDGKIDGGNHTDTNAPIIIFQVGGNGLEESMGAGYRWGVAVVVAAVVIDTSARGCSCRKVARIGAAGSTVASGVAKIRGRRRRRRRGMVGCRVDDRG